MIDDVRKIVEGLRGYPDYCEGEHRAADLIEQITRERDSAIEELEKVKLERDLYNDLLRRWEKRFGFND